MSAAEQARNKGGPEVPVLRVLFRSAKGTMSAAKQVRNKVGPEVPVLRVLFRKGGGEAARRMTASPHVTLRTQMRNIVTWFYFESG